MDSFKKSILAIVATLVIPTVLMIYAFTRNVEEIETLHVYTWSDYIEPEVVHQFEEQNNCKICIDTFADNESMLAKLMSGANGYDVIFPSSYIVPVMVRNKLVDKLDLSQLSNVVANLDKKFSPHFHKDTLVYSVPYAFSVTGLAYRNDKVDKGQLKQSWDDLKHPMFSKRVSLLRDVREMFGIGLRMNHCSVNSTDPNELDIALKYIKSLKKYVSKLDNEMYRTAIVNGELHACIGYSSDVLQIMFDSDVGDTVSFYIPDEGSTCCWDEMVVASSSTKKELAHKFIDFLYNGKVAAQNMSYICSAVPNNSMWDHLDEKYRNNYLINLSTQVLNKVQLIKDIGSAVQQYNDRWDKFMSYTDE